MNCFLQFFFEKISINFFIVKIINNNLRHSIANFFNDKNFLRPIWSVISCENIFIFWYYNNIIKFKFRSFSITFFNKINICAWFYISRLYLNCAMICIVIFINYIISLINTLFHYSNYYIIPISYTIILPKLFNWSIEKFIAFVYPYFIWFAIRVM